MVKNTKRQILSFFLGTLYELAINVEVTESELLQREPKSTTTKTTSFIRRKRNAPQHKSIYMTDCTSITFPVTLVKNASWTLLPGCYIE